MKEKEIYNCLTILERTDKAFDKAINEDKLKILKDLHLLNFRRFTSWEIRNQEVTTEWKLFLSNFDDSWKGSINREIKEYPYLYWMYAHLITFLLSILWAQIINKLTS